MRKGLSRYFVLNTMNEMESVLSFSVLTIRNIKAQVISVAQKFALWTVEEELMCSMPEMNFSSSTPE